MINLTDWKWRDETMLLKDHVLTGQRILVTGFTGRLGGAFAEYRGGQRGNRRHPRGVGAGAGELA
jgi:hypothetical protein